MRASAARIRSQMARTLSPETLTLRAGLRLWLVIDYLMPTGASVIRWDLPGGGAARCRPLQPSRRDGCLGRQAQDHLGGVGVQLGAQVQAAAAPAPPQVQTVLIDPTRH